MSTLLIDVSDSGSGYASALVQSRCSGYRYEISSIFRRVLRLIKVSRCDERRIGHEHVSLEIPRKFRVCVPSNLPLFTIGSMKFANAETDSWGNYPGLWAGSSSAGVLQSTQTQYGHFKT